MFGSIGMSELVVIFIIALVVFGPRRLPELGRQLGRTIAEFKRASRDLQQTLEDEVRAEEQRTEPTAAIEQPVLSPRQSEFSDLLSKTAGGDLP